MMRFARGILVIVVLVLSVVIAPAPAAAETITAGGGCTLADAIVAANTDTATGGCAAGSGDDTIVLEAGATYTLTTVADSHSFYGDSGLPGVTTNVTIEGNGAIIERNTSPGIPPFRILRQAGGNLTLRALTLRGGRSTSGADYGTWGGCVFADGGSLTIDRVTMSDCSATDSGGAVNSIGQSVTITGSTFNGNSGYEVIRILGGTASTVTNSTISDNQVTDGIASTDGTTSLVLTNVTITTGLFSAAADFEGKLSFSNSILVPVPRQLGSGTYTDLGNNVTSNPNLGPLQDNGGPTMTRLPLPGSPAFDAAANCPATDQRGIARPQGLGCDIGAVEVAATAPVLTLPLIAPVNATSLDGAVVTFAVSAVDYAGDPVPTLTCSHASGVTYPTGTTTVSCTATDALNQTTTGSFDVTVVDVIAPVTTVTAATDPGGVAVANGGVTNQNVELTFSATDGAGGGFDHFDWYDTANGTPLPFENITQNPATYFSAVEGAHSVTYGATDVDGNEETPKTFTFTIDRTAPVIVASNITANATSPSGATVTFAPPVVSDNLTTVTTTCDWASGSVFPIGTTTVTCTATDAATNSAQTSFTVTVLSGGDLLAQLRADTITYVTNPTTERTMVASLDKVRQSLDRGNSLLAYMTMLQYIVQLDRAVDTRAISPANAMTLIAEARLVMDAMM